MKPKPSIVLKILIYLLRASNKTSQTSVPVTVFCSSIMPFVAVEMKAILCNMHQAICAWSDKTIWAKHESKDCVDCFLKTQISLCHWVCCFGFTLISVLFRANHNTDQRKTLWMKLGERIVWNEWKLNYTLKNSLSALHNSVLCISFRL